MAEMIIKSPDPKVKKLHDYEFKSAFGATLMGATLCPEDGDVIEFGPDEIRITRTYPATEYSTGGVETYTLYRKDVAAIRHLIFDKPEPTVEQQLEMKKLLAQVYAAQP